jgi:hypothetical protein
LLRFPDDWDTLMYHLPLVDHWLQAQDLYASAGLRWSDPGNNELLALWLVAPFSGDFLHALNNLPAAILLACGAFELGKHVGLASTWRHLTSLAAVTNFVVFRQVTDAENDVAVAACFITFLGYAYRYSDGRRRADLVLGAVTLGILAGVKFYALGYAGAAGITALALLWRRHDRGVAFRAAAIGMIGCVVFGGYWYVRNWIAGGSPLYPIGAPVESGRAAGGYPDLWATTFLGNGRPELPGLTLQAVWGMTGPCHLIGLVGLPISFVWLLASARGDRCGEPVAAGQRDLRLTLAAATLAAGFVWGITPFAVEDAPGTLNQMHWQYCPVRYGMCFLTLSVIAAAVTLQDLGTGMKRFVLRARAVGIPGKGARLAGEVLGVISLAAFAGGVLVQTRLAADPRLHGHLADELLVGGNALLLALNLRWVCSLRHRRLTTVAVGLLGVVAVFGITSLARQWHAGFIPHYDKMLGRGVFRHIAETQPPGTTICVLDMRAYPFFGSFRQFRVCQPPLVGSYKWWISYKSNHDVKLLAARFDVGGEFQGWRLVRLWIVEHPEAFVPVKGNGVEWPYSLYEVGPH